MIAYKGFEKNLSCRGYQFKRYGINETTEANCRQNGFHCAENPLDCLVHYPNWRNSRYFVVKAFGDLDEDDRDTKISCTKMELKEELDFSMLLLRGAAYMAIHPDRPWCSLVCKETGVGNNGFVIVRGKQPKAKGRKNDLLILVQEEPDSNDSFKSKSIPARMLVILAGSLMNFLLPIILFYVLRSNALKGNEENTTDVIDGMLIFKCVIIAVVIGVYDGIYGPGTGTFLMLLFTGFCHMTLNDAAGTTKAINLTTNITALVVFLINGKVLLPLGIAAGVCNMAGNYLGSHSFTSNGHKIVKPVMIVVIVIFFIKVVMELI